MSRWNVTSEYAKQKRKEYWTVKIKRISDSDEMPSDKQLLKALAAETC